MISPFAFAIWRQHPQFDRAKLKPVRRVTNKDFKGVYGHVGLGWNVLIGFSNPYCLPRLPHLTETRFQ